MPTAHLAELPQEECTASRCRWRKGLDVVLCFANVDDSGAMFVTKSEWRLIPATITRSSLILVVIQPNPVSVSGSDSMPGNRTPPHSTDRRLPSGAPSQQSYRRRNGGRNCQFQGSGVIHVIWKSVDGVG